MDRSAEVSSNCDFDRLLVELLADHSRFEAFEVAARAYVRSCSRRSGRGLPADVQDEVINETYAALLCKSAGDFDPERGSAFAYLRFGVRHAARRVRASYTPAGEPTRPIRQIDGRGEIVTTGPVDFDPDDHPAKGAGTAASIEARIVVGQILATAPRDVALAITRQHSEGRSLRQTAALLGMNPGALSRRVGSFLELQRRVA